METLSFDQLPVAVTQLMGQINRIEGHLLKLVIPPIVPQKMDFNGALEYLNSQGLTFSKSKLQKSTADEKIPCKKFNNRLVFEKSELDKWIEEQTVVVGDTSTVTLLLAESANRKLRGGYRK